MKTNDRFTNEYSERLWKRQHGMLKCEFCNKKLRRLSSNLVSEEKINGKIQMMYWIGDNTGYSGYDVINRHINCIGKSK